jgi:nitrite reductase/ring-hydroxylating ferredoxin subunit
VNIAMDTLVCDFDELEQATPRVFRINSRMVALVKLGGEVRAIDAFCPHWKGPLGSGKVSVERREIICPWHLFRFSLDDGSCVAANDRPPVEVYPVSLDDGKVRVRVPEKP